MAGAPGGYRPDVARYIASSPQAFRALYLLAIMNAALRPIGPALDAGVDFSAEYEAAVKGQQG